MTTIRRLFLYMASFIGMVVTLVGSFNLIQLIVEYGFDAFRDGFITSTSQTLAMLIVGGVAWRFYWRAVQREATSVPDERASGLRKTYLYGTLALSLLVALILLQQVLGEFFTRLLGPGLQGYKPWTLLLFAAVLGLNWRWHDLIAQGDTAANADGTRGADLRRGYWFALAYYGIVNAASGLSAFLSGLLSHLGGRAPAQFGFFGGGSWQQTLIPTLMQTIVSSIAVWMFWLPSQKAAASGDETERASRARTWLIHLILFSAIVSALNGAQMILVDVMDRILRGFPTDLFVTTINAPLASLIVGGLLLWYFFKQVRSTLPSPRLSEYLMAGAAFFFTVIGIVQLVSALFQTLGGQGERIEELITRVLPWLLVGGGVWYWRWRWIDADVSGADGTPARSNLWRKVYLYFYQLVGLVMILIGAGAIVQDIIAALLGQSLTGPFGGGNALIALATPLAFLLTGSGLLIYMMQIVSGDGRLVALAASAEAGPPPALGSGVPTWAIAAAVGFVLGPFLVIFLLALLGPVIGNIFNNIVGGI